MDTLNTIFSQLGIDQTFFYQFFIFFIFFILAKFVFIDKLGEVIRFRLASTHGLMKENEAKSKQIETLSLDYRSKLNQAFRELHDEMQERKIEITKKQHEKFNAFEKEQDLFLKDVLAEIKKDHEESKGSFFKDVDTLSKELVDKVIN